MKTMRQEAPFPEELEALVRGWKYKAGWGCRLYEDYDRGQDSKGLTLIITTKTQDSYHPDEEKRVAHLFIVPAAAYDKRSWQRWLLDQHLLIESHEACEFFEVDGVKPYAPSHGHGQDPYMIRELGTEEDVRMSFRNTVNPDSRAREDNDGP